MVLSIVFKLRELGLIHGDIRMSNLILPFKMKNIIITDLLIGNFSLMICGQEDGTNRRVL